MDDFPVVIDLIEVDLIQINGRGIPSCFVCYDLRTIALKINRDTQTTLYLRRDRALVIFVDKLFPFGQLAEHVIVRGRIPPHQPQLVQLHTGPDDYRECARDDFQIESASISLWDPLELSTRLGNEARKNIQTSGTTFRVCFAGDILRKCQALD